MNIEVVPRTVIDELQAVRFSMNLWSLVGRSICSSSILCMSDFMSRCSAWTAVVCLESMVQRNVCNIENVVKHDNPISDTATF